MLSFLKTDIDLSEEIALNQLSDFISSVGGNLGLFVGISFLSALLTLVEWFRKIPLKSCFWVKTKQAFQYASDRKDVLIYGLTNFVFH